MKYDTVLFDLDGTILNSLEDLTDSLNLVLESGGHPKRSLDEVKSFTGQGYHMLIASALPKGVSEDEIERCIALYFETYLSNMANKSHPYEGIPSLIQRLKDMGLKLGVVSNKYEEAVKESCRLWFPDCFDVVIGDSPTRQKKPSPDGIFEALSALYSEKTTALYVGDSEVDIKTAQNAGIVSVGVSWGFRTKQVLIEAGADHLIDVPEELFTLLL